MSHTITTSYLSRGTIDQLDIIRDILTVVTAKTCGCDIENVSLKYYPKKFEPNVFHVPMMGIAQRTKTHPRVLATEVMKKTAPPCKSTTNHWEVTGPGYITFSLSTPIFS